MKMKIFKGGAIHIPSGEVDIVEFAGEQQEIWGDRVKRQYLNRKGRI